MSKIGVATCVKNEGRYLIEWIAWQRLCGFDEISIYDNGSTDETEALLRPLSASGLIRLIDCPDKTHAPPQIVAFDHALRTSEAEWLMLCDADEFLVIKDGSGIGDFLAAFPDEVSQVCFNWRMFGSSGHVASSPQPVVARFTLATPSQFPANKHVKAITRRSDVGSPTIHAPFIASGVAVLDDGLPVTLASQGIADRISHARAQLNHYVTKSREEFEAKIARGRGAVVAGRPGKVRSDKEEFWLRNNSEPVIECMLAKSRLPKLAVEMTCLSASGYAALCNDTL